MARWLVLVVGLAGCSGDSAGDGTDTAAEVDIEGAAFQLLTDGLVIPGAEPDLGNLVKLFFGSDVYINTYSVTDTTVSARMAFGDGNGAQDTCVPTTELPSGTRSGMDLTLGPDDLSFQTATATFVVEDLVATTTISDDGDELETLVLTGSIDLRQAVGFATFTDAQGVCDDFGSLGVPCGTCDDGEPYCAPLTLERLSAVRVDVDVAAVSQSDVAANCPTQ